MLSSFLSKYSKLNDNMSLKIFYTIFGYFFVASGLSLSRICLYSPSLRDEIN